MEKNSVNNKIINSFREVDLSAIAIPSIAIYKHPRDIPDKYVARVYAYILPEFMLGYDDIEIVVVAASENERATVVFSDIPVVKRGKRDEE